jgi:hypothetical protein
MAEKRAKNNVKEAEETKANEALRRKAGKVRKKRIVQNGGFVRG